MVHRLDSLIALIGRERSVRGLCQTLHLAVTTLAPPATGAMLITCADESEHECATAFQQGFVNYVLPALKFAQTSPFRLANLGGRYEWAAAGIAEEHYAGALPNAPWKLVVVKVNAHVAVTGQGGTLRFGVLDRYGKTSPCCGALQAALSDGVHPFVEPIREIFASEGVDRLARLRDADRVDPDLAPLYAALTSARLQARSVMMDVQEHAPRSPTLWLVVPCVTLNRPGPDTEILCGVYVADRRAGAREHAEDLYLGLGDDPSGWQVEREHDRLWVRDPSVDGTRPARDHREVVWARWRAGGRSGVRIEGDERIHRIRQDARAMEAHHRDHGRMLLKSLLVVLAEVAPVPAAVTLFAYGAAGIHHAFRAHRLTRHRADAHDEAEARRMIREIHDHVDLLDPERARVLLDELLETP